MKTAINNPDDSDPLSRFYKKLRRAQSRASEAEEFMDDVLQSLNDLRDKPSAQLSFKKTERTGAWQKSELAAVAEAARGATELSIVPTAAGFFEVQVDKKKLLLSPKLGMLLQILARDTGRSDDSFVEWKPREVVRTELARQAGSVVTNHALTNLVYRLRKELRKQAKLHQSFVQAHPKLGLRFALQRKPVAMTS